jgi:hypothetical protein
MRISQNRNYPKQNEDHGFFIDKVEEWGNG